MYLGDYPVGAIVDLKWNSQGLDGASITLGTDGTLRLLKANATTPRSSAAGLTFTEDFPATTGALVGVHHLRIDTSDDTDPGWYAAGSEIQVVVEGAVVDGKTVNTTLASWSIERAGGVLALLKAGTVGGLTAPQAAQLTAIEAAVDPEVATLVAAVAAIQAQTDQLVITGGAVTARLSAVGVDDILDEIIEGATTLRQSLRLANSANAAKTNGMATTTARLRDLADTKDRVVATVDADGNRIAVTVDAT